MNLTLICHPDTPADHITGVSVAISQTGARWVLEYSVSGDAPLIPPAALAERADGLWQSTCFELFVMDKDGSYTEFNFAPSTRWAAYSFSAYREGMTDAPLEPPRIQPIEKGIRASLDFAPPAEARIALCAVIEETSGTKSYWALAHPSGRPDFHHPDCFALTLPAPSAP